jgi:hypothetical protein
LSKAENQSIAVRGKIIPAMVKKYDDYKASLPQNYVVPKAVKNQSDMIELEMKLRKLEIIPLTDLVYRKKVLDQIEAEFETLCRRLGKTSEGEGLVDIHRDLMAEKQLYAQDLYVHTVSTIPSDKIAYLEPKVATASQALLQNKKADRLVTDLIQKSQGGLLNDVKHLVKDDVSTQSTLVQLNSALGEVKSKDIAYVGHVYTSTLIKKEDLIQKIENYIDLIKQEVKKKGGKSFIKKVKKQLGKLKHLGS